MTDPLGTMSLISKVESAGCNRRKSAKFSDRQMVAAGRADATCRHLVTAPGYGPILSNAMAALVIDPGAFNRKRVHGGPSYRASTAARFPINAREHSMNTTQPVVTSHKIQRYGWKPDLPDFRDHGTPHDLGGAAAEGRSAAAVSGGLLRPGAGPLASGSPRRRSRFRGHNEEGSGAERQRPTTSGHDDRHSDPGHGNRAAARRADHRLRMGAADNPPGLVIVGRSHTPAAPSTIGGTGADSFRVLGDPGRQLQSCLRTETALGSPTSADAHIPHHR
jgi:hypothetical protein